mgnify:FL=1|jgi:hypothetical protein|tara:strand:+ start:150 stop:764 length:615 start_codon:yes stop_codon:yes gene_type:complete
MFGAIKAFLFKNKDSIAENIWSQLAIPIDLAKLTGTHTDFSNEFLDDDYLVGYFNSYQDLMARLFFKIKKPEDRGLIVTKILFLFDSKFDDAKELIKFGDILKKIVGKKATVSGSEHAFMTIAIMLNDPKAKSYFLNDKIYLEAQKFYDDGGFEKRANLQKAVLGSLATGKNAGEMPKDFAIAYRVFELTFVKHLNKKFKVKEF